jgi:hypothetical protein
MNNQLPTLNDVYLGPISAVKDSTLSHLRVILYDTDPARTATTVPRCDSHSQACLPCLFFGRSRSLLVPSADLHPYQSRDTHQQQQPLRVSQYRWQRKKWPLPSQREIPPSSVSRRSSCTRRSVTGAIGDTSADASATSTRAGLVCSPSNSVGMEEGKELIPSPDPNYEFNKRLRRAFESASYL